MYFRHPSSDSSFCLS